MDDFERELKLDFLNEARDLVTTTEASFLELERDPTNESLIDLIFRFAHNLKGTSRAVGFGQIAELTHTAENILLKIKKKEIPVSDGVVSALLQFNDQVRSMIEGLSEDIGAQFDNSQMIELLSRIEKGEVAQASAPPASAFEEPESTLTPPPAEAFDEGPVEVAPEEDPNERLQRELLEEFARETGMSMAEVQSAAPAAAPAPTVAPVAAAAPSASAPAPRASTEAQAKKEKKEDETIRVSLARLEKLSNSIGELVILQAAVERALLRSTEDAKTGRALSKLCKDIQELSMAIRMVPLATTFQKLQRTVRDTTRVLGKKVDFVVLGEDTEIDRTVLEHLGDPLVHLIRNAVDHGIEVPEERLQAGKNESGTVEVMACHEGNFLVIQITDDGKGMDPKKLISKAVEKGILRPGTELPEQDALGLIFHPGFSTKEQVSEVSGRGVGLDVVKTNIESLGGDIKLQSKLGVGSCIRLMLPLTLAIIDGMLVSCGTQLLILPRNQIHEIVRLDPAAVSYAGEKTPFYRLRQETLPLFHLASETGAQARDSKIILVIRVGGQPFGVVVDDVQGQQQVVVKPPTPEIAGRVGMMGTTILGDGKPAIIIDLIELYGRKARKQKAA